MNKSYLESGHRQDCFSCGVCQSVCPVNAIEEKQNEAFFYPFKTDKCIHCDLCLRNCPADKKNQKHEFKQKFYAAWNKSIDVIKQSSSGGIFSSFAKYIFDLDGVVYGAAFDQDNIVKIIRCDHYDELDRIRGSKYVKAHIGEAFYQVKEDLKNNKYVLYTGTPCQVKALRTFLNKDYEKLFCIDIVCHGTPSPIVLKKYVDYLEEKEQSSINEFKFRYKKQDEHSYMRVVFENGHVVEEPFTPERNMYARVFYSNIALSDACTSCQFNNLDRSGDMTIGDFWGLNQFDGIQKNQYGNSLLILNNEKAAQLLDKMGDYIDCIEVDGDKAVKGNPPLYTHTIEHPLSRMFKKYIRIYDFEKCYKYILVLGTKLILPYRILRKVLNKFKK